MKKHCTAAVLFLFCSIAVFGQAKPRLGILPFTGGTGGDGETIATLFSFEKNILDAFTVVPRTSAVNALVAEQNFQMSGYTDSDTIVRLGRLLNADFVVSGHIRRMGDRNLVITTVVNVQTFEQLAGDHREYRNVEEIPNLLPDISKMIINASRQDTSKLPKLAILPFNIANKGVNVQDAEVLAQILSIEIGSKGKYIVLPRIATLQAAMKELEFQMTGATAEEEAKALGKAINAEYVLSVEIRSLGATNMFTASILHVEEGSLLAGGYRNYRNITGGMRLMAELAGILTADKPVVKVREKPDPDKAARLWTAGISAGSSFSAPWLIGTVHGTIAPFKNLFLEIGFDYGMISGDTDVGYYSLYPFAHLAYFRPFTYAGGWYAGAGGGYMLGEYDFPRGKVPVNIIAADIIAGVNIGNMIDISYTLRTDFGSVNNKVSVGYTYRF